MRTVREIYKSMATNFLTPDVLEFKVLGSRVVELSKGHDFQDKPVYGVSEFIYEDTMFNKTERGDLFWNKREADKHYKHLVGTLPK